MDLLSSLISCISGSPIRNIIVLEYQPWQKIRVSYNEIYWIHWFQKESVKYETPYKINMYIVVSLLKNTE